MQLTFLGTSCMVPTKERNQSAQLLTFKGENILIDCGEGTQRQMKIAGIKPAKITKILITHWHGDHVLGLPGLLQTISASEYQGTLQIYGPYGTERKIKQILSLFDFDTKMAVRAIDIEEGMFFDSTVFSLEALPLKHRIRCLGYRFTEKNRLRIKLDKIKEARIPEGPLLGKLQRGQSITWKNKTVKPEDVTYTVHGKTLAFIFDTLPCKNAVLLAQDANLLVCEAVYATDLAEKGEEYKHLTAEQAAGIAKDANAKQLIITHMSQRYRKADALVNDAKAIFSQTSSAYDFLTVKL